jgi:hypothetical protein
MKQTSHTIFLFTNKNSFFSRKPIRLSDYQAFHVNKSIKFSVFDCWYIKQRKNKTEKRCFFVRTFSDLSRLLFYVRVSKLAVKA